MCELILYGMYDELISPPLTEVQVVSLIQINQTSQNMKLKTAQKLGYKFNSE